MEDLVVKEFDKIEYLKIREIKINGNIYSIFMDINTQSKVIICDKDLQIIKNKEIAQEILNKVFETKSNVMYEIDDDEYYEENHYVPTPELEPEELQKFLQEMKNEFFHKFGIGMISKKELDSRIAKGVKSVAIGTNPMELENNTLGIYYHDQKKIIIRSQKERNRELGKTTAFHEFIHGITGQGAIKNITNMIQPSEEQISDEAFCYGRGVNEGIVSYIQNMEHSKQWLPRIGDVSYPAERLIITQISTLYENIRGDNELNFIEQYIADPEGTLPRINKIFLDYYKNQNSMESSREINLQAMRDSLHFVIELDDITRLGYRMQGEDAKIQITARTKILQETLVRLYESQISRKEVTNQSQLYELLYQIEGFSYNLIFPSNEVEQLKSNTIQKWLQNNPEVTLDDMRRRIAIQNRKFTTTYDGGKPSRCNIWRRHCWRRHCGSETSTE